MENRTKPSRDKFITWLGGPIVLLLFAIGIGFVWRAAAATEEIYSGAWIFTTIMFIILPWGLVIWSIGTFWKVVTLDETGIRRSLFGFLFKRKLSWDELHEIRIKPIPTGGAWLYFSKMSLEGMSIGKARTRKGTIQIALSPRLIRVIRKFTDKEIINLPESMDRPFNPPSSDSND